MKLCPLTVSDLLTRFDPTTGAIEGYDPIVRRLSDLRGCFHDNAAYEAALSEGDPIVYSVSAVEPATGAGALHYGIGCIMPGRIGDEYFMTKGHLHAWRHAAEFYFGLSGRGMMLLEGANCEVAMVPLLPHSAVYVPGETAHRTMNIGMSPLIYVGVYPAEAGHDYAAIAERNFEHLVIAENDEPVLRPRRMSP